MNQRTKDRIITILMTIVFIAVYCIVERIDDQRYIEPQTKGSTK